MSVLIRGGTVVTADLSYRSDILCEDGKIAAIGEDIDAPSAARVVDAGGQYVMPGGIDPHTHMQLPFMGTVASDDFFTGTAAGLAGGTTMIIDFVIPNPQQRVMEAFNDWRGWAEKATADYAFHVAITWWDDTVSADMESLVKEHGINSFKHFMAYKGAIMADDEVLVNSFSKAFELGAIVTCHAENGELVYRLQQKIFDMGITGPGGASPVPTTRGRGRGGESRDPHRGSARRADLPRAHLVPPGTRGDHAGAHRGTARVRRGAGRASAGRRFGVPNEDFEFAAGHVMSPPFRPKGHKTALWAGLQAGTLQTTATDHCCFCADQKAAGKDDFRLIPNGTAGVENRLEVLWHHGVSTGRLTMNEFVAVTSTNAAKIFNIYPRKGAIRVGSDADIVVWDPAATKTISAKTHRQNIDFNIFEGMDVVGTASHTISQGKVVYADGELDVERGAGQYIEKPPFAAYYDALQKRAEHLKPTPVDRR